MHVHLRPFVLPQPTAPRTPKPQLGPDRPEVQRVSERLAGGGRGGAQQQQPDRRRGDRRQPEDDRQAPRDPAASLASTLAALALAHISGEEPAADAAPESPEAGQAAR